MLKEFCADMNEGNNFEEWIYIIVWNSEKKKKNNWIIKRNKWIIKRNKLRINRSKWMINRISARGVVKAWFNFHFLLVGHISQSIFWDSAFQPHIQDFLGERLVQPKHFRGAWQGNCVLQLSGLITPWKAGLSSRGSPRASKISIGLQIKSAASSWPMDQGHETTIQVLSQHGLCKQLFGKGIAGICCTKGSWEGGGEHKDVGQINWGKIAAVLMPLQEFQLSVGSVLVASFFK